MYPGKLKPISFVCIGYLVRLVTGLTSRGTVRLNYTSRRTVGLNLSELYYKKVANTNERTCHAVPRTDFRNPKSLEAGKREAEATPKQQRDLYDVEKFEKVSATQMSVNQLESNKC